jgi:hypothetical protein
MPKTGETCQTSGIYEGRCAQAHFKEIALSKNERFPPCHGCQQAVTWTLKQATR